LTSYGLGMKSVYRQTTIPLAKRLGLCTVDNKKRYINPSRLLRMSVMVSVAVSQVGMTELIFVNHGVKVNGQYYCDVLLSQQMLPAIIRVAERCLFTKQYVAYGEIGHNNYAKNYCNRTLIVEVIAENIVTYFFGGHSV